MKKIQIRWHLLPLFFLIGLVATPYLQGQVSYGGRPASFEVGEGSTLRSTQATKLTTRFAKLDFNVDDFKAQNLWTEGDLAVKPLIIGGVIPVDIDFAKEAKREELPSGQVIYLLRIATDNDAEAVSIYYKDFFIPEDGGSLYIYTPDRANVLGAYTYRTHPQHGAFATEILPGSELILEYVLPPSQEDILPSIHIDGVNYIFNRYVAQAYNQSREENKLRGINDPEDMTDNHDCVINVNCPEGDEWHAEKASVAQIVLYEKKADGKARSSYCTGSLVNNTNQDFRPLILTAAHCVTLSTEFPTNQVWEKFMFSFHYEKPGCSSASYSEGSKRIKTMTGCKPVAFSAIDGRSDGLLLEITQDIPLDYNVYYSGWDSSDAIPTDVIGMHHPAGDAMKFSYLYKSSGDKVTLTTWRKKRKGQDDEVGCTDCHFNFMYNKGDTYPGSSGSPLWNQDHHIIGTLTGGTGYYDCHASTNYYGRLYGHWDLFANQPDPATGVKASMHSILDPKNGGATRKLDGTWRENARTIEPIKELAVKADFKEKKITLEWKDIPRDSYPSHWKLSYILYRNDQPIAGAEIPQGTFTYTETFDQALSDKGVADGGVRYGIVARYSYNSTFTDSRIVTNGIILGAYVGTVKPILKEDSGGIELSWEPAGNLQEICNFGYPDKLGKALELEPLMVPGISIGRKKYIPPRVAIGSRFSVEDLVDPDINVKGTHKVEKYYYVNSVRFIPGGTLPAGGQFKILVMSKDQNFFSNFSYGKKFSLPSDWKPGDWVEVYFDRPLKFDPRHILFVGVSIPNSGVKENKTPAVALVKGTKDERLRVQGLCFVTDDKYSLYYPYWVYDRNTDFVGYPAIRVQISTVPSAINLDEKRGEVNGTLMAYSKKAIPMPSVLGYRIFCNGEKITIDENGKDYVDVSEKEYFHSKGKKTDDYRIEVVYDVEGVLTATKAVPSETTAKVYPTKLSEDGILFVANHTNVKSLLVYSLEGTLLKQFDNPPTAISLQDLPQGTFIVVLMTDKGDTTTTRIIR